jgi:lipopolysaccharide assembly outer membrane protein LptD (OstA)
MLARSLQRLILIIPLIVFCQNDRLRLKQADLLENKSINGQATQFLSGNVIFTKGEMTIWCDRAQYHEKTGQGLLVGHVVMEKETQNLNADSVHYDSSNDIFTCYNSVHIWDEDYDLTADTVIYYSELDSGIANGNSQMVQEGQTITAHHLRYAKQDEEDAVSYTAEKDVTIVESDRTATCGLAIYDVRNDRTWLKIKPKLEEEGRILEGSEIQMFYENDVLDYVYIPAKAHAVNSASGFREVEINENDSTVVKRTEVAFDDDMTGSVLKGYFAEGSLDSVRLEGMATTLYHIFEDSVYQGNNLASGDTVIMLFKGVDSAAVGLENIHISGGSQGVYTPDTTNKDMETPITYTSDEILYDMNTETTDLTGEANIKYTDVDLTSGFINVDWNNNLLKAFPTAPMDTTAEIKKPTIIERGRDPMIGDTLVYNLKSRKGRIKQGRSKADDGYYTGNEIRNRDQKIYYIQNSSYTTCDLETPHFHFESTNMKIINQDKVIARPIVLYISRIPIIGLPFGIFPHKSGGRHSGWIMPGYGENSLRGQYINNLGYFWAPGEHWGTKFTMSFGDRQGFVFNLDNQYRLRYKFNGSLRLQSRQLLSATDNITEIKSERSSSYQVRWSHSQKLRHNQSLNVNANYSTSGEFSRKYTSDPQQRMSQQQTISNATYAKRWPSIQASMSMNLSSTTNLMANDKIDTNSVFYTKPSRAGLQTNITTATLPSMNFTLGQRNFFPSKGEDPKWFNNITWRYNTSLTNKERYYYESEEMIIDDTTSYFQWNDDQQQFRDNVMRHSMSFNSPTKILRYITFNPSISLKSDWVNRTFSGRLDSTSNSIISTEVPGFATRTTGNFSANLNTQIYGLFPFNVGKLIAVRHVLSPSIGYSYKPDFSQPVFGNDLGYFESILDTSGNELYHDRFSGTLAGGTSRNESQSINFSVNNNFQAKIKEGSEDKIINLFSWRTGTSYNFVADQFRLNNLSSSIRSKIGPSNIDLRMTHDFYEYDTELGQRINVIRKNSNGVPHPRLTRMNLSTGFQLSGQQFKSKSSPADTINSNALADSITEVSPLVKRGDGAKGKLWSTRFSIGYSLTQSNPEFSKETFWLNTNSTINITKNWRVSYNARFDLMENELISHSFSIYRDLHCWELALDWTPSGYANGFYLRINVKSPTLRDLKVEQRGGFNRNVPY